MHGYSAHSQLAIFPLRSSKDDRSLDTLLEFINGPEEENHKISSRAAKRQRRKQRKVLIHTILVN